MAPTSTGAPAFLTPADLAAMMHVSIRTLQRAMEAGERAGIAPAWVRPTPRVIRWRASDVARFFDELTRWRSRKDVAASVRSNARFDEQPQQPVLRSAKRTASAASGSLRRRAESLR